MKFFKCIMDYNLQMHINFIVKEKVKHFALTVCLVLYSFLSLLYSFLSLLHLHMLSNLLDLFFSFFFFMKISAIIYGIVSV